MYNPVEDLITDIPTSKGHVMRGVPRDCLGRARKNVATCPDAQRWYDHLLFAESPVWGWWTPPCIHLDRRNRWWRDIPSQRIPLISAYRGKVWYIKTGKIRIGSVVWHKKINGYTHSRSASLRAERWSWSYFGKVWCGLREDSRRGEIPEQRTPAKQLSIQINFFSLRDFGG